MISRNLGRMFLAVALALLDRRSQRARRMLDRRAVGRAGGRVPRPDRPIAEIISPMWATEEERDAVENGTDHPFARAEAG